MAKQRTAVDDAIKDMVLKRDEALREAFTASGLHMSDWLREVTAVARTAAQESDYGAAVKAYELVGKHLGKLGADSTQQHLHLHGGNALAALSDDDLRRRLIQADVLPQTAAPAPIEPDPYA